MGRKTMPEGATTGKFTYSCYFHSPFYCLLKTVFVDVVQKQDSIKSLILCGGGYLSFNGEVYYTAK
jgi:hypothetical protein